MKKTLKIGTILVLAVALMVGLVGTAFAEDTPGNVTYEGGAEEFVVVKSSDANSDLFAGVSELMPGDSITQKIQVKVNYKKDTVVILYLRAETPDAQPEGETAESMRDFLNQLSMTVKDGDGEVIFDAKANELGGLKENVLLGTFSEETMEGKKETELTVTLSAPLEMDNTYANRKGYIDWVFVAEEVPIEPMGPTPTPDPDSPEPLPQTGQLWWPVGALILVGLIFIVVALLRKGKQTKA